MFARPRLRILFICTANVCRSPLAEGLLQARLRERGIGQAVRVASAGTRVAQPGRPPDPRMQKLALDGGASLKRIRAQLVTPRLLQRFDYILAMDRSHLDDLSAIISEGGASKVRAALLGRYLVLPGDEPEEVMDPYFGDAQCFATVYRQIDVAVSSLADEVAAVLAEGANPPLW